MVLTVHQWHPTDSSHNEVYTSIRVSANNQKITQEINAPRSDATVLLGGAEWLILLTATNHRTIGVVCLALAAHGVDTARHNSGAL
jgi:hypothetical protein